METLKPQIKRSKLVPKRTLTPEEIASRKAARKELGSISVLNKAKKLTLLGNRQQALLLQEKEVFCWL